MTQKKSTDIKPFASSSAVIIPRGEHILSRKQISAQALKVLYRLQSHGYDAYLVGGSVRDLLLGRTPKDFDVATNAKPERVAALFRNCRLIGRRFRLAHVHFGDTIIEVATFRANDSNNNALQHHAESGMILRDNVYGTLEEDAFRRDFTVNALYYNINDFSVVDYTDGMNDLQQGILRMIGDPFTRYREDPVRMLRAVRFASKLGFEIEASSKAALTQLGHLLHSVPKARLFEEFLKLFLTGNAVQNFNALQQYQLLPALLPHLAQPLSETESNFILLALANTDNRLKTGLPVTPAFLLATLLWHALQKQIAIYVEAGQHPNSAEQIAINEVLAEQAATLVIPKRMTYMMREIWLLQKKLQKPLARQVVRLVAHTKFRAAYDFLTLRTQAGEPYQPVQAWWTTWLNSDEAAQKKMLRILKQPIKKPRKSDEKS